jgi:hypothetical protein
LTGCIRPAEERVASDETIGLGYDRGEAIQVEGGHLLEFGRGVARIWAQGPVVRIHWRTTERADWTIVLDNAMPASRLRILAASGGSLGLFDATWERATLAQWEVNLGPGATTIIGPDDANVGDPWRFAVMGDIQTALDSADEIFEDINLVPDVRFVMSTGDLVEDGYRWQYDLLVEQLQVLNVPYFSTIGNHELANDWWRWAEYFGRYNINFEFKTVHFSFVDAGSATIDPTVYDWLDEWLRRGRERVHFFGMHYPAIDPVGVRHADLRSRNEAALLLTDLAEAKVDATFYGHVHSYYEFDNAGIPAYNSGGGGASPERLDDVGRHFLAVDVDPATGVQSVEVVEVDASE